MAQEYSVPFTKYLGQVGCLVLLKPLGIGSAEQCWGDVKQMMGGQQMNLAAEKCSMLATIQGKYRAELAAIEQEILDHLLPTCDNIYWDKTDMDSLGLLKFGLDINIISGQKKQKHVFCAYFED